MSEPLIRTKSLVRDIMNGPIISASPTDTIREIAIRMAKNKVGSIVIFDNDKPVGIVTDGDIATKAAVKDVKPSKLLARDIMSKPLHIIEGDKDIRDAARTMRKLDIKRLGVEYKKKLVGMISITDIVSVTPELMDLISEKAQIIAGEQRKRSSGYLAGYCDFCNQWSDYLLEVDGKYVCEECREGEKIP